VLAASTLTGDSVQNSSRESLGKVDEIMIDIASGKVAYAVLSFGGFLGMGEKLFALPGPLSELTRTRNTLFSISTRRSWRMLRDSTKSIGRTC